MDINHDQTAGSAENPGAERTPRVDDEKEGCFIKGLRDASFAHISRTIPTTFMDIPAFRYHPDPIGTGGVEPSKIECVSLVAGIFVQPAGIPGGRGQDRPAASFRRSLT